MQLDRTDGRDFRLNRACSISPFNTYSVFNFNIDMCFILKHTESTLVASKNNNGFRPKTKTA